MKLGAVDFITKPFSHEEFKLKIERILERIKEKKELARLSDENIYLRDELAEQFNYGEIIGKSKPMQEVYQTLEKVAPTDSSVLIYGESGTGKELIARAIHKLSPRKDKPFIRVNCGALVETLLESELFGHEKGAFTGAMKRKKGRFELAHQGSIFLDEIGDISAAMQLKLLRVLQEKEFERVGSEETIQVDVRVMAATNKNLSELVQQGKFREDLYYRLHIIPIYLPPLRERNEDIPLLVNHFLKKLTNELNKPLKKISDSAMDKLLSYHWPGNIRELENVIERAVVLCDRKFIDIKDLPLLSSATSEKLPPDVLDRFRLNLNDTLANIEKQLIERAMNETAGNKSQAAKLLGIQTSLLYYKLEKFGINY
jgi:DNA-binding NtrC family response regulator